MEGAKLCLSEKTSCIQSQALFTTAAILCLGFHLDVSRASLHPGLFRLQQNLLLFEANSWQPILDLAKEWPVAQEGSFSNHVA